MCFSNIPEAHRKYPTCSDQPEQDHTHSADFRLGSTGPWSEMQNFIEHFSCRAIEKKTQQKNEKGKETPNPTHNHQNKAQNMTLTVREGLALPGMVREGQVVEATGSLSTGPPRDRKGSSRPGAHSPPSQRHFVLTLHPLPLVDTTQASLPVTVPLLLAHPTTTDPMTWTYFKPS